MGRVSQVQKPNPVAQAVKALLLVLVATTLIAGCASRTVKSASYEPVVRETGTIAEQHLLDVGIAVFDTGLDRALKDEDALIFPEVRKAESHYMPHQLMESLQQSAAWGAVRMVPDEEVMVDVLVTGEILQSDGEQLRLKVKVADASGRKWFEREYEGMASKYAYERRTNRNGADPFQGVYNQIANDMLAYRDEKLAGEDLTKIRTIAELRFARSFSQRAFDDHIEQNKDGRYEIRRLPAVNDPMLERIHRIRERDYLFVDTLQEYYGSFVREMERPYQEWRGQSYEEVIAMRNLQRSARNRTIAGVAAIIGGIAAAGSNNGSSRAAGQVGVLGGGYMVKSGFDKRSQAEIHVEALLELGNSLEAEVEPRVIELEDRTITLSGTVENQYNQWRELLQEIYRAETGGAVE